jgi:GntR family transcriptional repressor for pyruvate dehydrogenase complex
MSRPFGMGETDGPAMARCELDNDPATAQSAIAPTALEDGFFSDASRNGSRLASTRPMSILEQITAVQGYGPNRAQEIVCKLEALIAESASEVGTFLATKEDLRRRLEVSPATMNEAIRILESGGIIKMRPGVKGGIFIATSVLHIALRHALLELNRSPALLEDCWVVLKRLEPLVLIEAVKKVTDDAVAELNRLISKMTASLERPSESFKWSCLLYQKIAAISSNSVLTAIYTALLNVIEHESDKAWRLAHHLAPQQALTTNRRVVDAIASRDTKRLTSLLASDSYP